MVDTERRFAVPVLVALAAVPWTAVVTDGSVSLFFTVGFLNFDPFALTTITDYYFAFTDGLPRFLTAYGIGVLLFVLGIGSAVVGLYWREDVRVTAALLALAGLSQVWFAAGFFRRAGATAYPLGTILLFGVVWWYYWPPLKQAMVGFDRRPE